MNLRHPSTSVWLQRFLWLLLPCCFEPAEGTAAEVIPLIATVPALVAAKPDTVPEYNLKAGFLLTFTKYVEWPAGTFAKETDPFVLGVLGVNPFGEVLEETVRDLKSHNRPIEVRYIKTAEDAAKCQVVFIAGWQKRDEVVWLRALHGKPVLTVTESESSMAQGAVISFVLERVSGRNKIRFDASVAAAREAGLQISSEILQRARKIYRELEKTEGTP